MIKGTIPFLTTHTKLHELWQNSNSGFHTRPRANSVIIQVKTSVKRQR